jgi:hypothetical protein
MKITELVPGKYYRFLGYEKLNNKSDIGAIIHFIDLDHETNIAIYHPQDLTYVNWRFELEDIYEEASEEEVLICKIGR